MKVLWALFSLLLTSIVAENATAQAQAEAEAIEQLLLSMPKCGVSLFDYTKVDENLTKIIGSWLAYKAQWQHRHAHQQTSNVHAPILH